MTSTARKERVSRRRPVAKQAKAPKIARVRASTNGKMTVLANDAKFRKHVADALEKAPQIQRVARQIGEVERAVAHLQEIVDTIPELQPATIVTPAQRLAREELYDEMLKHGPAPTESEQAQALSSWL